ncbi:pyrroline-5-carboxylate reductase [Carnimonas bestiolae]|uniref:pyrroline-5-carboxylate reductase n=1 Tax=Carnimonas bestiolae TaxID=3402172 RepID=UPI003EDBCA9E
MPSHITFIGAGHMAQAIIRGLIHNGHPAAEITATATSDETLAPLAQQLAINTTTDNNAAVTRADVVILAVKPQGLADVCESIKGAVQNKQPLIMSVAAGVRCEAIERWLGDGISVIRTMPNTPSLLGRGAAGLYANDKVDDDQRQIATEIMQAVGIIEWVEQEELLSAVTAIAGSAPAYFYYLVESLENAGVDQGLPRESARRLAIQTALGAAEMCALGEDDPATLKRKVMSPKGTTEQAIFALERGGFENLVKDACNACAERAEALAEQLDTP